MPEESVAEVIRVIRAGLILKEVEVSKKIREQLTKWCDKEEECLKRVYERLALKPADDAAEIGLILR